MSYYSIVMKTLWPSGATAPGASGSLLTKTAFFPFLGVCTSSHKDLILRSGIAPGVPLPAQNAQSQAHFKKNRLY